MEGIMNKETNEEINAYRVDATIYSNNYKLVLLGFWGDPWYTEPTDMEPNQIKTFVLNDHNRGGIWYAAFDSEGKNQLGFVTMSFICPYLSDNSAEGSPSDTPFVSAGTQTYIESGGSFRIKYKVGQTNLACWNSGDSNDGKTKCSQTTLADRRALIIVNNMIPEELTYESYWNDNSGGESNWYFVPNDKYSANIPADCTRFFVLKDNDRAGLYFNQDWMEFHMSLTCPKWSSNSAEGSPHAGLQTYSESGTPVTFTYNVGTPNLACWSSGSSNNGGVVCKQTLVLPFHLRRWMGKLNEEYPDRFKNMTLRELFIPGTHDAACFENFQLPWGQTQEFDYYNQLIKGVRYMDLRPHYTPEAPPNPPAPGNPAYNNFHHGLLKTVNQLGNLLSDIVKFYTEDWDKRQYEIIILDFTHFGSYSTQAEWEFFFNTILKSTLNSYLIPQGTFRPTNTILNSLWTVSSTQRVIASVSSDAYTAYKAMKGNKPNIWNGANLFAPGWNGTAFWPNKNNEQDLVNFINTNIDTFSANTNLWALQAILTATPTQSVHSLVDQARDALYGPTGLPWRSKTNIVITDYYDERTTIETIMENIKRMQS